MSGYLEKASETLQYGTAKASETLQYGTAKASETLQYSTAKASETLQYGTAKASETLQYGTAKASETLQYGTREIGRVANEVATKNNISSPLPSDFISEVNKAATILSSFTDPDKAEGGSENVIPKEVILKARGLAIFNVLKAGLVWSGRAGSGIVIARTKDESWSSPSCINIAGVGFGAQVGADVTNFVIVLNTDEAVKAFSRGENITLGGNLSVCAGPIDVGTEVSSSIYERSALYSYSNSKGFFAGVSVEGTIIMERKDTNKDFYKDDISAAEILSKKVDSSLLSTNNELYEIIKRIEGEKK